MHNPWAGALAFPFLSHGHRDEAEEAMRVVQRTGERTRDSSLIQAGLYYEGVMAVLDGRFADALDLSQQLANKGRESGAEVRSRVLAQIVYRIPLLYLGRGAELLATPVTLEEDPVASGAYGAVTLAYAGQLEEANLLINQIMVQYHVLTEGTEIPAAILCYLLEAAVLVSDTQAMAILCELLAVLPPMAFVGTVFASPTRLMGTAVALLGKPDEARKYYAQALDICTKTRFRPEIALIRLSLAELLLEHYPDEHDAAIKHLDFAIAEFREMKMQPSLERALRRAY